MASPTTVPKTALLLVDNQRGLNYPGHWGPSRSTPNYESNLTELLGAFRKWKQHSSTTPDAPPAPFIIHIFHRSIYPTSPLHPEYEGGEGMKFFDFAEPEDDEVVIGKSLNSPFVGTNLEAIIREKKIERLFVAGMVTDHCVSTTVRYARDLGVCDVDGKKGKLALVQDACATWGTGEWDAETVHRVHVESLRREFADIIDTAEVLQAIKEEGYLGRSE